MKRKEKITEGSNSDLEDLRLQKSTTIESILRDEKTFNLLLLTAQRYCPVNIEPEEVVLQLFGKFLTKYTRKLHLKLVSKDRRLPFLIQSVKNSAIDHYRKEKRRRRLNGGDDLPDLADEDGEIKIMAFPTEKFWETIYTSLDEQSAEILKLWAEEGYKLKEIGELLGINHKTVETKKRRAIEKLRKSGKMTQFIDHL